MGHTTDLARRLVRDVWNGEREETAFELVDDQCPGLGVTGPQGMLAWHHDRRTAFPDVQYEIVEVTGDDELVAVRWHATGTQLGQFGPVPPTGRTVSYNGATFLRFNDAGKIVDVWSVNELFQVLQQLGAEVIPPPHRSRDSSRG